MSFLGNIVSSIGGDKAPPPPPPRMQANKPTIANAVRPSPSTATAAPRPAPNQANGIKRKAEESTSVNNGRMGKITAPTDTASPVRKPAAPPLNAPKPTANLPSIPKIQTDKLSKLPPSKPSPTSGMASPKPPPTKGSFAELMARANAQKSQNKIGVLTHAKAAPKDKLSKVAERRRQEQEKVKTQKSGSGAAAKSLAARRSASPAKQAIQQGRVTKPPPPPKASYKGTMGKVVERERPRAEKKSRYDDYLGTDEEDNSDIADDYDDGYESSDMEAGLDDIDGEEMTALREAKRDDAREAALETQLKREKDERRKKLMGLAAKRR